MYVKEYLKKHGKLCSVKLDLCAHKVQCEYKNKQMELPPGGRVGPSHELKRELKDSFGKDIFVLYTCMECIYHLSSVYKTP